MYIPLVCVFLLGGILLESAAQDDYAELESEPSKPNAFENKYYFEAVLLGNYHQALQFCNYHGLTLLSIESAEEDMYVYNALQNFLADGHFSFWTSGTRLPEDHWVWLSTGKPIVYTPWTSQPLNSNMCLDVSYSKNTDRLVWDSANCSLGRHTICETPSSSVSALAFTNCNSSLTLLA